MSFLFHSDPLLHIRSHPINLRITQRLSQLLTHSEEMPISNFYKYRFCIRVLVTDYYCESKLERVSQIQSIDLPLLQFALFDSLLNLHTAPHKRDLCPSRQLFILFLIECNQSSRKHTAASLRGTHYQQTHQFAPNYHFLASYISLARTFIDLTQS